MSYFWCTSREDGTHIAGPLTKDQLAAQIAASADGMKPHQRPTFLSEIPKSDGACWMADENAVVIIKGEIVVPKPVTVATQYEIA